VTPEPMRQRRAAPSMEEESAVTDYGGEFS
jgi:hypothetical protein